MTSGRTIAIFFTLFICSCEGCGDDAVAPQRGDDPGASREGSCRRGGPSSSGGGRGGRGRSVVKEGGCLWFEHHDREKYLNICVRRVFEEEAELTSEWRLYDRIIKLGGRTIAPDRLSHHVTPCTTISRSNVSVLVYDLEAGQLVLERL